MSDDMPKIPTAPYRLKTLKEYAKDIHVDGPTPAHELASVQIKYLLDVINMLNPACDDMALAQMPPEKQKLFIKRDDVEQDPLTGIYYTKENK